MMFAEAHPGSVLREEVATRGLWAAAGALMGGDGKPAIPTRCGHPAQRDTNLRNRDRSVHRWALPQGRGYAVPRLLSCRLPRNFSNARKAASDT